jgi:hypothetical protein
VSARVGTAMRSVAKMTDRMQIIIRQKTEKKTLFFVEVSLVCRDVYLTAALYISST